VHICFCSPDWPPAGAANGIVSYVSVLRDYFMSQGHDVSVISHERIYRSNGAEIALFEQNDRRGAFMSLRDRISQRLDRYRGDLPGVGRLIAEQVNEAQSIAPIDILEMEESFGWSETVRRATGVPVITRLHGPFFLNPAVPRTPRQMRSDSQRCRAEGRAVRSARSLTAPTRAIMDAACAEYDRQRGALSAVIPNPISLSAENQRWSLQGCDPDHILMVGRFDYRKGADTMLLAFERLLERRPSSRLTIVGPDTGMEIAPGQSIDFETFAQSRLLPRTRERVTFLGKLGPDQIAKLRRNAYVTVIASRYEIFPYALFEGFAMGCPMICTDWPGSDEIIAHGHTGLVTPVGDPEAMANNLEWIFRHRDEAVQMAQSGLQNCRNSFCVETVGGQMLDFYRATLEASGR
jgi:glycosyltransferase involved in cell wall biosynthesis